MTDTKHTILIVDDNKELCDLLTDGLTGEDLGVIQAYDGEAGLAKALAEHPDLILLDVMMPKMDGWEMLERLRADEWGKDAEVVMLTNAGDMESISKAVDRGTFEYLIKTELDIEDVLAKVKEKLGT